MLKNRGIFCGRKGLVLPNITTGTQQLSRQLSSTAHTCSGENNEGPLHGLKILDLSRVLAAPFCTQILADYGANIIKIEAIGKGDDTRHWLMKGEATTWKKKAGPISNYFSAVNRNKRSVTLDIKHPKGKEVLLKLAKNADVLSVKTFDTKAAPSLTIDVSEQSVENFKPGTMDRLGLGYTLLKEHNPRLIYASISGKPFSMPHHRGQEHHLITLLSGYGTSGPFASRGGYDPIAGAEAGLLHVTGERTGPPVRPGIGIVDMATGLYLHGAILAALQARERVGKGQRVDASLFETQISLLTNVGLAWLNLGIEAQRWGCQHPSIAPYDAFKTKDAYLVCGATNNVQFASLCGLLGLEALINDDRFSTNPKRVENRDLLGPIFNDVFGAKTTTEWIHIFGGANLPFAPINNMEQTFAHPQVTARDMVAQMGTDASESGQINMIGPAVKFSKTKTRFRTPPARLGQHTSEVLAELGIDASEVNKLREQGVV